MEMIFSLLIFFGLALIVLGIVAVIPKWVIASTEAESDPDHIYNIFHEESGFRGEKIISAAGCLFPYIELSKPVNNPEGIVLITVIAIACSIYHSTVYKDYPVLTNQLKLLLALIFVFFTVISLLMRFNYLSGSYMALLIMLIGPLWGSYVVYRRAKLIRIKRL